jgi:hypothetical protein
MNKTHGEIRHWAVNDGRDCIGIVDLVGEEFVARDAAGKTVGRFTTLAAAAAVFNSAAEREPR